jgi:hypothetical protein
MVLGANQFDNASENIIGYNVIFESRLIIIDASIG